MSARPRPTTRQSLPITQPPKTGPDTDRKPDAFFVTIDREPVLAANDAADPDHFCVEAFEPWHLLDPLTDRGLNALKIIAPHHGHTTSPLHRSSS
ncbi:MULTISPECIES: hypothetical protein [Actinomyces]|uniref:hypothetical protein n=1 Tax=Actinomyces TaxID=1654 RepID=UPI00135B0A9E|nr:MULTISPECIES: hypothetical protein [Actinomyces]